VEAAKPGEPAWEVALGAGPARLAHRVLGDELTELLGNTSTSMAAARTCSSRTTRTRSPRARARTATSFVNYWMHNGFVRVDDEKMSKSLGNFFTIREVLGKYDAEVVRFFILRAHYRSPLNYSDVHLDDAKRALTRLYTALKNVPPAEVAIDWSQPAAAAFKTAMDDDFGTPEAMAVLFELANEANRTGDAQVSGLLKALGGVLGLLQRDPTVTAWHCSNRTFPGSS
jgi:cysteinyl-tRNA synthetase